MTNPEPKKNRSCAKMQTERTYSRRYLGGYFHRPRSSPRFRPIWQILAQMRRPGATPVHARRSPARRPPSRAFPKVSRTPPPRTFHPTKASPRTHDHDGCHATFAEHRRARPRARDSHFRRTVRRLKKIPGARTASRRATRIFASPRTFLLGGYSPRRLHWNFDPPRASRLELSIFFALGADEAAPRISPTVAP